MTRSSLVRSTAPALLALLAQALPAPAQVRSSTGPLSPRVGTVVFGGRLTATAGDPARHQRYSDLRDGPSLDALLYAHDEDTWSFAAAFDHVGYRDQRYAASIERFGRVKVAFVWDQVPLFYSADTRTPYTRDGSGVLQLPDALQGSIQNGSAGLLDAAGSGGVFSARARRDVADLRIAYAATAATEVRLRLVSAGRTGEQPWAGAFGFSLMTEVPRPIDDRTSDLKAEVEWAKEGRLLRVAYDGSFYRNAVDTLVWDNPIRLTDTTSSLAYITGSGTSLGRMALPPSNTSHTVSAMGSAALPARSRAYLHASVGSWSQNEQLLPHTVNSALASPPLSRATADASARVVSGNLGFTSRPADQIWLNARLRLYDFDNRTPRFTQPLYVRADQAVFISTLGGSEPFGYTRNYADVDASYTPVPFVALGLGYGREHDSRSYRFLEETTEDIVRATVDSTHLAWLSVRARYERAVRAGTGFDEEVLSDVGEQISLRQFDISDRVRDRVTTTFHLMPTGELGLSASVGAGSDTRPDAAFGLQNNDHWVSTVGLDYAPSERVGAAVSWGREQYETIQRSRQANPGPQFDDPTRDWATDVDETVYTAAASLDLAQVWPRTDVRITYDFMSSRSRYLYRLFPGSSLAEPEQLPPATSALYRGQADARYDLSARVAVGASYAYERFDVDDFALSPGTLEPLGFPGSGLFLGYFYRPYRAHSGWLGLIVGW